MGFLNCMMDEINQRVKFMQSQDYYFYLQPIEAMDGAWVTVGGRQMLMFASYSYLGLLGHPKINAAAQEAIERYGTGTHGVRILAGTLPLHEQLEHAIAQFKHTDDAIVYSSGYVTNLTTVAALVGRNDVVLSDKLNHASIVDGCLLSHAKFVRFRHNDMDDLERRLQQAGDAARLVVTDAVFSMDGDIINLPELSRLCREYGVTLMVDEAHSVGVLGQTGQGIEEHFGLEDAIDLKMGTLSKTIPSVGGYIAGDKEVINYLKHHSRAFVFSAALPPAQVAAAQAALEVMQAEPERVQALQRNVEHFLTGLRTRGFDTLNSATPIVPIICGSDERAYQMARLCQERDIFVLPVVSPAVPPNMARLRANVMSSHTPEDIDRALDVFAEAGKTMGLVT